MNKKYMLLSLLATFSTNVFAQSLPMIRKEYTQPQPIINNIDTLQPATNTPLYSIIQTNESNLTHTAIERPKAPSNMYEEYENNRSSLSGFQLGLGLGVLGGASAHLGYRNPYNSRNFWKNRFGFRVEYNTMQPVKKYIDDYLEDNPLEVDGNEFDLALSGKQIGALIDFYPFGGTWALGNFRISGGYYTGDFKAGGSLQKSANEIFNISDSNGNKMYYKADATADLTATLNYDINGPYAGLGFDFGLFWGIKMFLDAGVVFTDRPEVKADINGNGTLSLCTDKTCTATTGTTPISSKDNQIIQDLLDNTITQYKNELDDITKPYFPIVKIGFLFRF